MATSNYAVNVKRWITSLRYYYLFQHMGWKLSSADNYSVKLFIIKSNFGKGVNEIKNLKGEMTLL